MINLIPVSGINNYVVVTAMIMTTIITTMITPVIGPINTNSHYRKSCKIRWIKSVIIGWIIRYVGR